MSARASFVLVVALLTLPARAWAVDRNCPPKQQWSIAAGACVKKKPAPKLSPQEKYNQASDELEGKGLAKGKSIDPAHAITLLDEACAASHGDSCTLLGFLYARGRSKVARDDPRAMTYFEKACQLDDLEGCFNIGDLGVRMGDYPAARVAFQRACELGSGTGCARGADLIERGIGGTADPRAALPMFEKALAILGPRCPDVSAACFVVGILQEEGKGTPRDPAKAIASYRRGCDGGSGDACLRLASALDQGLGGAKDTDGANEAYDKACTRYDNGDACQKIGERLGIAKKNLPHAFELVRRGCELDPKYCGTLAEFYRLGFGIAAPDQPEATRYYKAACEAGGGWCENFGRRAHDGIGMTADPAAAQAALERGCKGGWATTCYQAAQYLVAAKTDDARASAIAIMGCDGKHGSSCYLAGWLASMGRAGGPASPERALVLYERGCALTSPVACDAAGAAYRAGAGAPADPKKAIERFEQACTGTADELFAAACRSWAMMAYFGEAGAKDAKVALAAFTRACKYGEPDTCGFLGTLVTETGGTLEPVLAVIEQSCKDGHEQACIALGNQLAASPRETDRRKAFDVFVASCGRKSDDGCLRQADLLADGWGITKDVAKAEELYRSRCDAGRAAACFGMARVYERQQHLDEALRMSARACDGGWADACSSVGFAYYTAHGVRWDVAKSATYFIKACDLGSSVGCANSGDTYRYGAGAALDHKKAFAYYEKACRPGDPTGCAGVGHYLATGEGGTKVDKRRAQQALRSACENEAYVIPEACQSLADLLDEQHAGTPAELARLRTTSFSRAQELAKDNPYYMFVLGSYFADGMATVRDPVAALAWFSKSCDGFDPLGCIAAGKALRATRKAADGERARVYYERACAAGVEDGCAAIAKPAIAPHATEKSHGCGCAGEIAPGGSGGLALVVLACLRRRRRIRPGAGPR